MNNIDYYMVTVSPWSYLSIDRLRKISYKNNLKINVKPIDLFSIFSENKTKMLKDRPLPVQKNRINELKRWSNYLNIELNVKPKYWPADPKISSKLIIASIIYGCEYEKSLDLVKELFKAVWVKDLDISDKIILKDIAETIGFKENVLEKFLSDSNVSDTLSKNTNEARKKNVFGVPTFIYNNELFWGQDRLFFLENHIKFK